MSMHRLMAFSTVSGSMSFSCELRSSLRTVQTVARASTSDRLGSGRGESGSCTCRRRRTGATGNRDCCIHRAVSEVPSVGSGGGASLRDAIRRPASGQTLPPVGAGTHGQRPARSVPVTEAGRRRPRSPPRRCHWHEGRAELVRRHRGYASRLGALAPLAAAGGFVYVSRDEPATHGRMWRCGRTVPAARRWCG